MKCLALLTYALILHTISFSQNPVELGDVHWLRDLAQAQSQSKASGKPILILFQEIPGCATCQRYGTQVMKHPLIVEAIETEFIPLAIHNNKGGEDGRVLKLFKEPSWNNPVVRIVDAQLNDLVHRLDGDYSPKGVTVSMVNALKAAQKLIPTYLQLLRESFTENTRQLTFGMYCFWEGEKRLGRLDGIISTTPGYMHGHEVVKVDFDPAIISPKTLVAEAKKQECASQIYTRSEDIQSLNQDNPAIQLEGKFREDQEPQYYLRHTPYIFVSMLPIQASRINSALGHQQDPSVFLSPRQKLTLEYYKKHPDEGQSQAYLGSNFK